LLETPGAYPRRKHLKGAPIGLALALPSSLLGLITSDEGKKFYNIDTWWKKFLKTFLFLANDGEVMLTSILSLASLFRVV